MIYYFVRHMKNIYLTLILIFLACSFFVCKKAVDTVIVIQGFRTTDFNGNFLGQVGPADHDWTSMTNLSPAEMALFNFDGPSLDNTVVTTPQNLMAYPNPANTQQIYYLSVPDSAVVKIVIVDANLKIAKKTAFKIKGPSPFDFNFSDRTQFPDHTSWRVYYSFSAKNNPNFMMGYGDIRICSSSAISDCF
jgi:hypothetical protein